MPSGEKLNDAFRRSIPNNQTYMTRSLANAFKNPAQVLEQVRQYRLLTVDNDPGEHDFEVFKIANHKLFWKIDVTRMKR